MRKKVFVLCISFFIFIPIIFSGFHLISLKPKEDRLEETKEKTENNPENKAGTKIQSESEEEVDDEGPLPNDQMTKRFKGFYDSPKKSIDVMLYGSSSVDRYWCAPVAWNDYGITGYTMSTNAQAMVVTRYMIEETLKTQSPKLIIIDIRAFSLAPSEIEPHHIQYALDRIPQSDLRRQAVEQALKFVSGHNKRFEGDLTKYYTPRTLKEEMGEQGELDPYKGFYSNGLIYQISKKPVSIKLTEEREPLHKRTEDFLRTFLDYCDTLKAKVLFVASPYDGKKAARKPRMNTVTDIIRSRGYTVLSFSTKELIDALGFDFAVDFYNWGHVNLTGAIKYTHYLSQYIKKNYKIPDRRGKKAYASWDESYKKLKEDAKNNWNDRWGAFTLK